MLLLSGLAAPLVRMPPVLPLLWPSKPSNVPPPLHPCPLLSARQPSLRGNMAAAALPGCSASPPQQLHPSLFLLLEVANLVLQGTAVGCNGFSLSSGLLSLRRFTAINLGGWGPRTRGWRQTRSSSPTW